MLNKSSFLSRVSLTSFCGLLLASVVSLSAFADVVPTKDADLTMNDELRKDIQQTLGYLKYQHYLPVEINNEYSSRTLDAYLKTLDPNKIFFTQADINEFEAYRYKLDDLLKKRDAEVAFDIFKVFRQRMGERTQLIMSLIESDFDFTKRETFNIDNDSFTWAKDEAELNEIWRKRIKNDTLLQLMSGNEAGHSIASNSNHTSPDVKHVETEIMDGLSTDEVADLPDSIKKALSTKEVVADTEDVTTVDIITDIPTTEKVESSEMKISEIRENLTRRYQRQKDTIFQLKADEVFEWFMNSYTRELGPHTVYMSHATTENFLISMSLSLEGIGAALQTEEDYTVINRIIKGGPAEKSGQIKPEDKIVGVAQEGEDSVNVIGWRLMDVVQIIRGKKGTEVTLQIISGDSAPGTAPDEITLVRDVIELEDQAAKMTSIELPFGESKKKFSAISIPSFYSNEGQAKNGAKLTTTTHDVRKLIDDMKKQGDSEGLIIDLRGNGGGYLNEAVSLSGLFIEQGPIVQVIPSNRKTEVLNDLDSSIAYDGPLVVLIDRFSASASEIFAAAMQDYGRAIIVGERSFGKGTVQRVAPLRGNFRLLGGSADHNSQVKFTNAQFFRVNGGSTQHKGVTPDILLNSGVEDEEFGERAYDNALPWTQTEPAKYVAKSFASKLVADLSEQHLDRSNKSAAFELLRKNSSRIAENRDIKELSLNMQERQADRDRRQQESIDTLNAYRDSLGLDPVTAETRKDNPLPGKDEHWNMVYQTEAAHILLNQINWSETSITKIDHKE